MATNHPFLGLDDDVKLVLHWFETTGLPFRRIDRAEAMILYFAGLGALAESSDGQIDQERSPLVWLIKPRLVRSSLWTSGEVIFTPTPLREQFPELQKLNRRLAKWFQEFPLVYTYKRPEESEWIYYLEGSIQNWHRELFALPTAYERLKQKQYFVYHKDAGNFLDRVCRKLRLRGVEI